MEDRGKSNLASVVGVIFVAVLLALVGAMVILTQCSRKKDAPLKSPIQVREDEIRNLKKLLQEDIADAHKERKTDAEIAEMKAKYQAEIDRLQAEIDTIKAGGHLDSP
jgi:hypothetical protein